MSKIANKKLAEAAAFIEELGWLLKTQKSMDLMSVADELRQLNRSNDPTKVGSQYTSPNPNIHFLIGILPRLFQDQMLFPSNASISDFADEILGIPVSRSEKRSKYELIGLIVCETNDLSDEKLQKLVHALAEITESETKLKQFKEARKSNDFSWNRAIETLSRGNT